jgi:hypothetical protein
MNKYVKLENIVPVNRNIFYVESQHPNQASLDLSDYLQMFSDEKSIDLISENRSEVQYQSINWYFTNIFKTGITIVHFLGNDIEGHAEANAFNSFWSGIACGFEKHVLLLAPTKFRAPLDYYDIMIQYRDSNHLVDEVLGWIEPRINQLDSIQSQETESVENIEICSHEMDLLKLGVGCEVAENERESLLSYFIPTYSYNKAREGKCTIIIGRKGSGKSAIFIKLAREFSENKLNYLINLKLRIPFYLAPPSGFIRHLIPERSDACF